MKRRFGVSGYLAAGKSNYGHRGRKWRRRLFIEDLNELFSLCLTVESPLYKYMRIYLCDAV